MRRWFDLMKLKWYLSRLRNMEPVEIVHRARESALKAVSRHRKTCWADYSTAAPAIVFPGIGHRILEASTQQRQAIGDAAAKTLSGAFSALGVSWPQRNHDDLFPASLWRLDPLTGKAWPGPETYTFDVDFRHAKGQGDIKLVWEIARLQQLPVLAAHALLTGDRHALATIETGIASWHEANPPFRDTGWASGIEVALRAISLIVTHDMVRDRLSAGCKAHVGEILAASHYWLKRFPSKFSSANNHRVAELTGEYLTGLALGRETAGAVAELKAESLRQFLPDGCGAEQSVTYAAYSAEFLLCCMLAAREHGQSFGSATEQRLLAFADFIAWLPQTAGFGDDDEGRVVTLGNETGYARSVASAIGGFLSGSRGTGGDFRSLFFGKPTDAAAIKRDGLRIFHNGGLSVWRSKLAEKPTELIFDHGPLGYLAIAAHGHADALSIAIFIDGEPVLVDPGTYAYGAGGVWRDWFRSTPAHNTLNIDGESQSLMAGAFNWSHKAVAALTETAAEPNWSLAAEHDGYLQRFGVLHRRRLARTDDAIHVTDQLIGASRNAELVFQLAAGLTAETIGNTVNVAKSGRALLALHFPPGAIAIASGGDRPGEGGWVSERFGVKQAAPRITWRGQIGPQGVTTVIRIGNCLEADKS